MLCMQADLDYLNRIDGHAPALVGGVHVNAALSGLTKIHPLVGALQGLIDSRDRSIEDLGLQIEIERASAAQRVNDAETARDRLATENEDLRRQLAERDAANATLTSRVQELERVTGQDMAIRQEVESLRKEVVDLRQREKELEDARKEQESVLARLQRQIEKYRELKRVLGTVINDDDPPGG